MSRCLDKVYRSMRKARNALGAPEEAGLANAAAKLPLIICVIHFYLEDLDSTSLPSKRSPIAENDR